MGTLHKNLVGDELHIGRSQVSMGNPNGVVTAGVIGEFYWDLTENLLYVAEAADNSSWIASTATFDEFIELLDTPSSISANLVIQGNSGGTALEFGQNLNTTGNPTFANITVSGNVDGRDVSADGANIDLNTTHRSSSGADHSFIDQAVTLAASPSFAGLSLEAPTIELGSVAIPTDVTADGGGLILKATGDISILWRNAKNSWEFNQSIDLLGNSIVDGGTIFAARAFFNNFGFDNNAISSLAGDLDVTTQSGGVFKFTVNAIRAGLDAVEFVEMGHGGGSGFINLVGDPGLDIRFAGATKATFTDNSLKVGLDATNLLEIGHGGSNAFIKAFGAGGLDFRFEGTTKATFTSFGHLHLLTDVDQKHTLKIVTANNLNDTGIAWENSGGSFTHTIFRTDVGSNRADLIFAAGQNVNIDLLINSFKIHGGAADEGKLEIIGALQISSGTPALDRVLTSSDLDGNATWQPLPQSVGWVAGGGVVNLSVSTDKVAIGGFAPDSKLHVTDGADGAAGAVTAFAGTIATFESSGAGYLSILTPDVSTSGILFGEPSNNLAGGIFYNDPGSPDGFQFRINGNQTKMVIEKDGIGMGTTNPDFTALLDLKSTTHGFLPPRMTTVQKEAIVSPATGLSIFDLTIDKPVVRTSTEFKTLLTEDLGQVVVQETFASTNVRFFGELALPAAQGWTDTATGIATIDLVTQTVFGEVKQVVRHNDDTGGGSTTSKITLTAQNWIDVNNFGASYSGTTRLDTVDGVNGFFSGLQANAAENPLATGNRRYGILFNSDAGNLRLIEADNNPGNSVTMDGTGGNPLITFDEWFKWECVVPAGLGAAEVYINGILTTFVPLFIVNGGGLGTQIIVSSGSTAGANRIAYHDNFGVTIFEEAATKTLAVVTMAADVAQVNIPEGKRDYVIILPDGNPRLIGSELRLAVNNLFGTITLQNQTPAAPEALFNGLAESVFTVFSKEVVVGVNTVDQGNVYIGFKAEDVSRSSAIFAQLHSIIDQIPADVNPTVITYTNHDAINGIGHSTTLNTGELEILPGLEGTYSIIAQPQVGKDSGGIKVDFNMFLQVDRGSGFVDEDNSNIELTIKDSDIRDVVVSVITIQLQAGDKIRMMQVVSNAAVGMGLKNTDPVVGPPTVPRTPSIIFGMVRIGGI